MKFKLLPREKYKKLLRFTTICFMAVLNSPNLAHAGAASQVLSTVGYPLVQLLVLCSFGWIISYILVALGHGQIAGMAKIITVFSCIGIVLKVVWSAISTVSEFFGVNL